MTVFPPFRPDAVDAVNSSTKRKRNRRKKKVNQTVVQEEQAGRNIEDQLAPVSVVSSSITPVVQEAKVAQSSDNQMNSNTSSPATKSQLPNKLIKKQKSGGVGEVETIVSPGAQRSTSKQVPISQTITTSASALGVAEFGVFSSNDLELILSASSLGPIYSASTFPCCVTLTSSSSSSQLSNQRIESSHLYGGSSFSTTSPIVVPKPVEKMSAPPAVQKSREEVEAERKARKAAKAAAKGKPKGSEKETVPPKPVSKEPNTSKKKDAVPKLVANSFPANSKSPKGAVEKLTENVKNLSMTDAEQAPNKRAPDEPDFAIGASFRDRPVEDVIPAALKQLMTKEGSEKSKAELRAERRAKQVCVFLYLFLFPYVLGILFFLT